MLIFGPKDLKLSPKLNILEEDGLFSDAGCSQRILLFIVVNSMTSILTSLEVWHLSLETGGMHRLIS